MWNMRSGIYDVALGSNYSPVVMLISRSRHHFSIRKKVDHYELNTLPSYASDIPPTTMALIIRRSGHGRTKYVNNNMYSLQESSCSGVSGLVKYRGEY